MTEHTDPGHTTGSHERTTRSSTRVGDSGAPVGSPLTIVLALIAVAVGFLIFRSISDNDNAAGGGVLPDTNTSLPAGATLPPGQTTVAPDGATTTPTTAPITRDGATVVVANASSTGQVAAPMSDQLAELGYTMGEPTSQIEGPDNLDESIVYFSVGNNCEPVARSLGNDMGGIDVEEMPAEVPTEGNVIDGCVLLMLGNDYAGEELPGPPPQTPAAPSIVAPTTTG